MKISIKESHIEVTPEVMRGVRAKLLKLGPWLRKLGTAVRVEVELEKTTKHHRKGMIYRAEINLTVPKKLLRAEAYGEEILVAMEKAYKEVEREIEKYKMSKEEKSYREGRFMKKKNQMTSLAWRGNGREEEQNAETVDEVGV